MSNTNGQATATPEGADDAHQSSESSKALSERTLTDIPMEDDTENGTDMDNNDHPSSINHQLIAVAETDNLTIPWSELKQIAKQRFLEIIQQNVLGLESNTEIQAECETLTARIIEIFDNMEYPPFTIQRFAELLVSPDRHYTSRVKYLRAVKKVILITSSVNAFSNFEDGTQTSNGTGELLAADKAANNTVNGQTGHLTDAVLNIVTLPSKEPLQFRHDHTSHEYQQELQHHMSSTASAVSSMASDTAHRELDSMNAQMDEDADSATNTANVVSDVVDVGGMTANDKEKAIHVDTAVKTIDNLDENGELMDTTV
ncbi:hypothetical protein Unana1_07802 [Umbelopsis nana]